MNHVLLKQLYEKWLCKSEYHHLMAYFEYYWFPLNDLLATNNHITHLLKLITDLWMCFDYQGQKKWSIGFWLSTDGLFSRFCVRRVARDHQRWISLFIWWYILCHDMKDHTKLVNSVIRYSLCASVRARSSTISCAICLTVKHEIPSFMKNILGLAC